MATVEERLLTVEEYVMMPDDGRLTELIRGRIVRLPFPTYLQGRTCAEVVCALAGWLEGRNRGRVVSNHSGIVTGRNPDTVRGPDIAYYSFERLPRGSRPKFYPDVAPEIVIEVRLPSERGREIPDRVAEYHALGVRLVCVIDPETRTAWIYATDQPDRIVGPEGDLTFPECLPEFSVPIRSLFE